MSGQTRRELQSQLQLTMAEMARFQVEYHLKMVLKVALDGNLTAKQILALRQVLAAIDAKD